MNRRFVPLCLCAVASFLVGCRAKPAPDAGFLEQPLRGGQPTGEARADPLQQHGLQESGRPHALAERGGEVQGRLIGSVELGRFTGAALSPNQ